MDGELLRAVFLVGGAYLVGSVPTGVLMARLTGGRGPRTVGSGRTGGTEGGRGASPPRRGRPPGPTPTAGARRRPSPTGGRRRASRARAPTPSTTAAAA